MAARKTTLIAAVLVTCYVDGVRRDIQPGEPVPELSPHDEAELKRMHAVVDEDEAAKAARMAAAEERKAGKLFQDARAAVIAAEESTLPPAEPAAPIPAA